MRVVVTPAPTEEVAAPVGTEPNATWMRDLPAPPSGTTVPADADAGAFAVDDDGTVYVAYSYDGLLAAQPPSGDPGRVLVRVPPVGLVQEQLFDLAIDPTHVWFTSVVRDHDGSHAAYALRRVPKAGGPAEVVAKGDLPANGLATRVFVDADAVYFLRAETPDYRYVLVRLPKAGGPETVLVGGLGGFQPVALDATHAWVEADGGGVARVPLTGGEPERVATAEDAVREIALSATHVYFTVRSPSRAWHLRRAPKAGGKVEDVATFEGIGQGLGFDRGAIHWVEDTTAELPCPGRIVAKAESLGAARTVVPSIPPGVYWGVRGGVAYWGEDPVVASRPIEGG